MCGELPIALGDYGSRRPAWADGHEGGRSPRASRSVVASGSTTTFVIIAVRSTTTQPKRICYYRVRPSSILLLQGASTAAEGSRQTSDKQSPTRTSHRRRDEQVDAAQIVGAVVSCSDQVVIT